MNEILAAAIVVVIVWKVYDSIKQAANPAYREARRRQNIRMERDDIRRAAATRARRAQWPRKPSKSNYCY